MKQAAQNSTTPPAHGIAALITLLCLSLLLSPVAQGSELQAVIEAFLYEQVSGAGNEVSITVFPPAAQFPDCPSPAPFLPGKNGPPLGRVSVGVRCADQHNSLRYLTAEVSVIGEWATVNAPVDAGSVISDEQVTTMRGDLASLPSTVLLRPEALIGQVARRRLSPGQPVREQDVRSIPVVRRGQEVMVESGGAGFVVRRRATAMEDGTRGDTIRVQLDRRNSLMATVTSAGTVRVH